MKFSAYREGENITFHPPLREIAESVPEWWSDGEISKRKKPRSLAKLRYFHWPVLRYVAEESGMIRPGCTKEEIETALYWCKEALKAKYKEFFPRRWKKNPLDPKKRIYAKTWFAEIDDESCGRLLEAMTRDFPWIPAPDTGNALAFYEQMMNRY